MWQVERNSEDFWKEDRLDELFKQVIITALQLDNKRLKHAETFAKGWDTNQILYTLSPLEPFLK